MSDKEKPKQPNPPPESKIAKKPPLPKPQNSRIVTNSKTPKQLKTIQKK